jgi:acetyl-CoA carboxylase carboxyltransferase component
VASLAHFSPNALQYAWPSGEWGSLPIEGGVAAAYRRDIEAAADPEKRRAELEEQHAKDRTPFPRAESFGLHDLIDPRDTRPVLVDFVRSQQAMLRTAVGPKLRGVRP